MPSQERNPFVDFINGLDSSNFHTFIGENQEATEAPSPKDRVRLVDSTDDKIFSYDIDIGSATFNTTINTDAEKNSFSISLPSKIKSFEAREMFSSVARMMEVVLPPRLYIPHVRVAKGVEGKEFDLGNYWQGKGYEEALKDQPTSVVYYLPDNSEKVAHIPDFRYHFAIRGDGDYMETIKISHENAEIFDTRFTQELLLRNREYIVDDIDADANDLKDKIQGLCKAHPKQKGWF